MTVAPTLTLAETAAELGRTENWLRANLPQLLKRGMPAPLHPQGKQVWCRAQFYAWKDATVPKSLRPYCAAYRAALAAAQDPDAWSTVEQLEAARRDLDSRFGVETRP